MKNKSWKEVQQLCTWNNCHFLIEGKPLYLKHWANKHVYFINDLIVENGNFLQFTDFKNIFDIRSNFLEYNSVISAIKLFLYKYSITQYTKSVQRPFVPYQLKIILKSNKGARDIYRGLLSETDNCENQNSKWSKHFSIPETKWKKFNVLPFLTIKIQNYNGCNLEFKIK